MTSRAERQRNNQKAKGPFNQNNIRDWFSDSGGILRAKLQGVKK